MSLLWGFWHLPLVVGVSGLTQLPIILGFHLILGPLLKFPVAPFRQPRTPGITHALIDAIRDGLAAT